MYTSILQFVLNSKQLEKSIHTYDFARGHFEFDYELLLKSIAMRVM